MPKRTHTSPPAPDLPTLSRLDALRTHRCAQFDDLRTYQRTLVESGRAAADELADLGQELGI
ncbi:hypothetical protein GV792_15855 [Nocardia cyriacigeorgica]|uniref:hypothetical protein n=1 Tax=Nocardia cyriacigeorgica TaxID=135487 RepID=UPI0013BE7209|nr:hypothetical protein [Nocardia cyriacigeorgica]NEW40158.1 hypothetical protein [Nocardia cyriacigeorgica]NEW51516.1 hypothetical protein [Nocardia cyriacigeorgica]